ncbi:hypothetical protein F183_A41250 [Bryobacterales bacterium F-183]|nr:hypothetical protein F183_A41250 [Bryobacterales bacterium F-183]
MLLIATTLLSTLTVVAQAEVREYPGGKELPHQKYIHMVSEKDSPIEQTYIKSKDGLYVAAAIRKPAKGNGPFPVLIHFHGAPGGRGMEQITGWARGDHGSPVFGTFLQKGYVIVIADYRATNMATLADGLPANAVTYVDDALAVLEHVRKLPYVNPDRITVYGVSLGGDVTMHLLIRTKVHKAILGAGAPISFLAAKGKPGATGADRFKDLTVPQAGKDRVAKVETPVLIQVGTADSLIGLDRALYDELKAAGKPVRLEIYENGYHDFVMGPQGQPNRAEPLLDITLKAMENSLEWVK